MTPVLEPGMPLLLKFNQERIWMAVPDAHRSADFTADLLGTWSVQLMIPRAGSAGNEYKESHEVGTIRIGVGDAGRVFELDPPALD